MDVGRSCTQAEVHPVALALRAPAADRLDLAATSPFWPAVALFVGGVGPPMDRDLIVLAEIEPEQRRRDRENLIGRRGRRVRVRDRQAGQSPDAVGHAGVVLEPLGMLAGQSHRYGQRRIFRYGGGTGEILLSDIVTEGRLRVRERRNKRRNLPTRKPIVSTMSIEKVSERRHPFNPPGLIPRDIVAHNSLLLDNIQLLFELRTCLGANSNRDNVFHLLHVDIHLP